MTTATATQSRNLKATLTSLVEQSRTNPNIADNLHMLLRDATNRNDRQQIELAIRHALANAAKL